MTETESQSPETVAPPPNDQTTPSGHSFKRPQVRIGALIAVAVAVGFIAWAVVGGGSDDNSTSTTAPPTAGPGRGPVQVSRNGLQTLAAAIAQPMYWIGPKHGVLYELRQTTDGKVYIRYVPPSVKAGDPRAFLTVGTYPLKNAYSVTQAAARGDGSTELNVGKGAAAFYGKGATTNAYIAFSGSDYQIEVYAPEQGLARKLVEQGAVVRVS
jgi:hypothetical protein